MRSLAELVRESLDLVDTHRPDVNTERARRVFGLTFEPCAERPAFEARG